MILRGGFEPSTSHATTDYHKRIGGGEISPQSGASRFRFSLGLATRGPERTRLSPSDEIWSDPSTQSAHTRNDCLNTPLG